MPRIVSIDGIPGVGKTTVLDELKKRGYQVYKQDISSWEPHLQNVYTNPKRWAFLTQIKILHSLTEQYKELSNLDTDLIFIETNALSSEIFTRIRFQNGELTRQEYETWLDMYNLLVWKPDEWIILKTPISMTMNRIKQRSRESDANFSLDYQIIVEREYEIVSQKHKHICIDASKSTKDVANLIIRAIQNE